MTTTENLGAWVNIKGLVRIPNTCPPDRKCTRCGRDFDPYVPNRKCVDSFAVARNNNAWLAYLQEVGLGERYDTRTKD